MTTNELIAAIKGKDENARAQAWMNAATTGADAVAPLAGLMDDKDTETRRAANRALWKIVRNAGRPGASEEAQSLSKALLAALGAQQAVGTVSALCWMLSEIAGDEAVAPLAKLLVQPELREHARAALQRIPGDASVAALKAALADASDDAKPALAESLRRRGVDVPDVKSAKLTPVKPTQVKPAGR